MVPEYYLDTRNLPINEDLERFAIPYTPETFTEEEKTYLRPFFSNLDRPVFVTYNLPEEVNAALDSRYSRSDLSKRRLFLKEYVEPIIYPERQSDWDGKTESEKEEATQLKLKFTEIIQFLNNGGTIDSIANVQRARKFFDKWLEGFGDDSIAEMGSGIHVSLEGISSLALEEIVNKRIGQSLIVKSTRYVPFQEKRPDGEFQYVVPGEIRGTDLEAEYRHVMDDLFSTYAEISEPYLEYIKGLYPQYEDESDTSFIKSRKAKRLDDIRDLLTFSTQNNLGLAGNGRAYEDLINRLLASPLGEERWIGQQIYRELKGYSPSFVSRPATSRGAEIQEYRRNLGFLREEMSQELENSETTVVPDGWATLVSFTPDAEVEILSTYIYGSRKRPGRSLSSIRDEVRQMNPREREEWFQAISDLRSQGYLEPLRERDRFKKMPRAFENARYTFDVRGRGGDKRDIHRHRVMTDGAYPFTTRNGYDLEDEVKKSPFIGRIQYVLTEADILYRKMEERFGPEVAQYAVPFTFIQRWYMTLSAREIYWIGELRTGPQGRPHYREIVTDMVDLALSVDPLVFSGIMIDRNDYRLARRESEKKSEAKKKALNQKPQ